MKRSEMGLTLVRHGEHMKKQTSKKGRHQGMGYLMLEQSISSGTRHTRAANSLTRTGSEKASTVVSPSYLSTE